MQREQLGNTLPASMPWASYVNLWFKGSRAAISEDWAQPQFKSLLTEAGFGAVLQEKKIKIKKEVINHIFSMNVTHMLLAILS